MGRRFIPGALAGVCAFATLSPTQAPAQTHVAEDMSDQAQTLTTDDPEKVKTKPDLLVVPIPISNPATGSGGVLAGVLFYNPNHAPQPWVTGVGALYTETGTMGLAAFHSMSLANDKFRFVALAGYADAKLKFYGIGPDAGKRDASVDIDDKGALGLVQAQMRLFPHFYAGGRLQFLDVSSKVTVPHPKFPDLMLPPLEANSRLVMIGPVLTADSRDSSLNPRSGTYAVAAWMFGTKALGGDFTHNRFNLQFNYYAPLGRSTVLASRVALCGVSRGAPFYDLCMFGQGGDLRGYETGRYRDRASWAVQTEVRQHLFGRFGAVAFAGVGGIAPDIRNLDDSTILPAAGLGLRFQASKANNINLRIDFAFGKDSHALYFGIGEAF